MTTKVKNMKTPAISKLDNNRGSALLTMLVLGAVIAITATTILLGAQGRQKLQSRAQAREDGANLEATIKMILTSHDVCKVNLTSANFGASLDELKSLSANKSVKLAHTGLGTTPIILAAPNSKIGRAVVTGLSFSQISPLDTATSYIADLHIEMTDAYGVAFKPITVPFYFKTDASGALVDCIATTYPMGLPTYDASVTPQVARTTMEDIICSDAKHSASYYYSPTESACVNTTLIGTR
jgi:hypothetical protein